MKKSVELTETERRALRAWLGSAITSAAESGFGTDARTLERVERKVREVDGG